MMIYEQFHSLQNIQRIKQGEQQRFAQETTNLNNKNALQS